MMDTLDLHKAMIALGITRAIFTADDGQDYEYIFLSPTEYQLGLLSNILTNYEVSDDQEN